MASHFCKDRCFLPRRPPPDSPTPSHLPAEGAGLEPGELQRRHPGDSYNPQTLPDFSASLHPCGKKSPPSPRATSRRDSPAETLGRREYPLQTKPPLRPCGRLPRPQEPGAKFPVASFQAPARRSLAPPHEPLGGPSPKIQVSRPLGRTRTPTRTRTHEPSQQTSVLLPIEYEYEASPA